MTQSGGTHMYYGKDGYWKKVQEYLPEENRLTGVWRPDEYFVGIGRFGIHIDHYRVKEPKARVILFHGVGGNGRLLSLIAVPLMKQGYEVICPDLPLYGMTEALWGCSCRTGSGERCCFLFCPWCWWVLSGPWIYWA